MLDYALDKHSNIAEQYFDDNELEFNDNNEILDDLYTHQFFYLQGKSKAKAIFDSDKFPKELKNDVTRHCQV